MKVTFAFAALLATIATSVGASPAPIAAATRPKMASTPNFAFKSASIASAKPSVPSSASLTPSAHFDKIMNTGGNLFTTKPGLAFGQHARNKLDGYTAIQSRNGQQFLKQGKVIIDMNGNQVGRGTALRLSLEKNANKILGGTAAAGTAFMLGDWMVGNKVQDSNNQEDPTISAFNELNNLGETGSLTAPGAAGGQAASGSGALSGIDPQLLSLINAAQGSTSAAGSMPLAAGGASFPATAGAGLPILQ